MLGYGGADFRCLAVVRCVVSAHDALQLGELADHAGGEVGLAEPGCAGGECRVGADEGGQVASEGLDPGHAGGLGAELGVEHDALEGGQPCDEAGLAVQVPEMAGVAEPGAEDALVAGDDGGPAVLRLDIGDEGEAVGGRAVRVAEGHVALVHAHAELHDLGRQVHEGGVDAAQQGNRPFDEARDLVDEALVLDQLQLCAVDQGADAVDDALAAEDRVGDDPAGEQAVPPGLERGGGEGVGGVEAVALGFEAADQAVAVIPGVGQGEGNERAVQRAGDAAERADPGQRGGAPAHALGPGEAADEGGDGLGHEGDDRDGDGLAHEHEVAALVDELVPRGAVLAEEALERLRRGVGARAPLGGAGGRHLGREGGGVGDAAGAMEGLDGGGDERGQRLPKQAGQIRRRPGLHAGGDVFAEELEEEGGHQ